MFTLIVNGVPAIKLGKKSEIPPHRGSEPWLVVDKHGRMVAYYMPE